jgi:serine phosphatase RsbU (regulator of sigma subunit)
LTQINPRLFTLLSYDRTIYGNTVFAIYSDTNYLWLGTGSGLLKTDRLTGETIKFFTSDSGLPGDTVTAIYQSGVNAIWIGTYKNGLYLLNPVNEKIMRYHIGDGTLENSITSIAGNDEQVWAGTKKGLCNINIVTNTFKWYSINQGGLPHNSVNSLFLDREERLWISTNSSIISYLEDGKINKIPLGTGSGIVTLGAVCEDDASRIWVGSRGNGVFIIDFDSILYLTTKQGLLSDYCYSLASDDHYNIWIGHKGGLSRVRTTDYSVKPMQNTDGIPNDYQCIQNALLNDQDQRILVGSDRGLIIYDPKMELSLQVPPALGITSIRVNDEETDFEGSRLILSPGRYRIRIDFFGASLKEPSLVTYQYMLEGYEQWSEIIKNTSVTYNQLTDGTYSFLLKASSGDGASSENPLELTIVIKTPLWKKWWFYLCSLLILSLLIILYVKWRIRRLIAEKRILEEKVIERTHEIECQKNEIEQQRDTIELKNNNITSSITYASQIQQAVLPPMELVERLLPEHFILYKPKDIVSGDFYWIAEKNDKIIISVSDCTGHGVPGAFMSLLGITLLNEIVNIQGVTRSDEILNSLREKVVQSLLQNRMRPQTRDGMDIALCVLDRKNKKLQYTGAMNDLVYLSEGNRMVIKSDFMDVSPAEFNHKKFTLNELDYKDGDMIYLFSDGYQDQFGGDFDKKFLRPHFYNTLYEVSKCDVRMQHDLLDNKLVKWMKGSSQTDDITVMGIRL